MTTLEHAMRGITGALAAGMLAMWNWPGRLQSISAVTRASVVVQAGLRAAGR
ncbi:MAG: hypothetical protein GX575_08880 [Candidatus Anammoximicrobium sp.]|nr:hypothetical protein [Candidatus Anammoximicrobium sp.]